MFCAVVTMACRPDEHSRFTAIATLHRQPGLDAGHARHVGKRLSVGMVLPTVT
jgi:hypothetical protein